MNAPAVIPSDTSLVIFKDARQQIAEAATADEVKKVLALATGLAAAARKATDKELEAEAAVLQFEAERKLGQLMKRQDETVGLSEGGRPKTGFSENPVSKPTLSDAGIDKNLAHRARQARAVPDADVENKKAQIRVRVRSRVPAPRRTSALKRVATIATTVDADDSAAAMKVTAVTKPKIAAGSKQKWTQLRFDRCVEHFCSDLSFLKRDAPAPEFSRLCSVLRDLIGQFEGDQDETRY
jgi:hypothetical protein